MKTDVHSSFTFEERPALTYGITPPRRAYAEERRLEVASAQAARLNRLPVDALVVYDLQDESSRTDVERPFPFAETIDPQTYAFEYLCAVKLPKIVYRSVGGLHRDELEAWLSRLEERRAATVLVGSPSREQAVKMRLQDAYALRQAAHPDLSLGGVVIAERHERSGQEVSRIFSKLDHGCSFFISQAVYSVTATKNLLSDLYYRCLAEERQVPPVVVTVSPCGSEKTLGFLAWLGVCVPTWLRNELLHAHDILQTSVDLCVRSFAELHEFAQAKGMVVGCNVESVSLRKTEIEASVELVERIARVLGR